MKYRFLEFFERVKVILATVATLLGVIIHTFVFLIVFILCIPIFLFSRDALSIAIRNIIKSGIANLGAKSEHKT